MKKFILFAHVYSWSILAFPVALSAQDSLEDYPNYVVIGAFAIHPNAIHFTDEANKLHFPARLEMNSNRNLFYVYVLATADRERAFDEARRLRADTKYSDAWVYSGPLGAEGVLSNKGPGRDFDPETGGRLQPVNQGQPDTPLLASNLSSQSSLPESGPAKEEVTRSLSADGQQRMAPADEVRSASALSGPVRASVQPLTTEDVVGKNFYFHLFRADNRDMVTGEVDVIDFEKSRKMGTYPGNSTVKVMLPAGQSQVSFVCQVFGYRKQQIEFNSAAPAAEFYLDEEKNLVLPFELMRLQKGDIAIMYNVFFFKDAAVMRPESRYEVNNLLELLVENPDYRIRIHGHTNGNASGKIIRMDNSTNFYSLAGTKQGFGSAKQLSEDRALVIRDFLISSGVDADRMEVKAWGGKKPIHDKHSVRANENVRVEVEILSD